MNNLIHITLEVEYRSIIVPKRISFANWRQLTCALFINNNSLGNIFCKIKFFSSFSQILIDELMLSL